MDAFLNKDVYQIGAYCEDDLALNAYHFSHKIILYLFSVSYIDMRKD